MHKEEEVGLSVGKRGRGQSESSLGWHERNKPSSNNLSDNDTMDIFKTTNIPDHWFNLFLNV